MNENLNEQENEIIKDNVAETDYKQKYEELVAEFQKANSEKENYKKAMQQERSKAKDINSAVVEKSNETESYKQQLEQVTEMLKQIQAEKEAEKKEKEQLTLKEAQTKRIEALNIDLSSQKTLIDLIGYDKISQLSDDDIKNTFKVKKADIKKEEEKEDAKKVPDDVENRLSKMGFTEEFLARVKGE